MLGLLAFDYDGGCFNCELRAEEFEPKHRAGGRSLISCSISDLFRHYFVNCVRERGLALIFGWWASVTTRSLDIHLAVPR
jgi:hypothetical protein